MSVCEGSDRGLGRRISMAVAARRAGSWRGVDCDAEFGRSDRNDAAGQSAPGEGPRRVPAISLPA